MASTKFTIYDPTTGAITRSGVCDSDLVHRFARPGEQILLGHRADPHRHRVSGHGTDARIHELPESARPDRPTARPDQSSVLIEALRAKGIDLSAADLAAAVQTLKGRDKGRNRSQ